MIIEERVKAFVRLGSILKDFAEHEFKLLAEHARIENPWFTEINSRMAVSNLGAFLDEFSLRNWFARYSEIQRAPKTIALIMAGNIPMVGFHDLLCVLINGDTALLKLSSKDIVLMKWIIEKIIEADPRFKDSILITERLKDFDAVIATGSDNSGRYFDYYFGKYPHIIRKNRTSVAILNGAEGVHELTALGSDVFTYFGLGCRNVSKVFVPTGYRFDALFESWDHFKSVARHHKYANNYDYQKSILLVTQTPFLENGFIILQQSERLVSPIAVLYFEYYHSDEELADKLDAVADKLQCIVGSSSLSNIEFGGTQCPGLHDYADQVDTLQFLNNLS